METEKSFCSSLDGAQIVFKREDTIRSTQIKYNPVRCCLEAGDEKLEEVKRTAEWFKIYNAESRNAK